MVNEEVMEVEGLRVRGSLSMQLTDTGLVLMFPEDQEEFFEMCFFFKAEELREGIC